MKSMRKPTSRSSFCSLSLTLHSYLLKGWKLIPAVQGGGGGLEQPELGTELRCVSSSPNQTQLYALLLGKRLQGVGEAMFCKRSFESLIGFEP